jgi:hypothetical protein
MAGVWSHLNEEFWQPEPPDQERTRPLALKAQQAAQKVVQGSKATLVPFKRP